MKSIVNTTLLLIFMVSFPIAIYKALKTGWEQGYNAAIIQYETGEDVTGTGINPFDPFKDDSET